MAIRRKLRHFTASGTWPLSRSAGAHPAVGSAPVPETSATIAQVQQLLESLDYYRGPQDGAWTEPTAGALQDLQIDYGLHPTGELDRDTLQLLRKLSDITPP